MQRFHIEDTAMILIDHQVGTNKWARTTPLDLLQRNVIILATFAKRTGMPVVLTSSQETNVNAQGPLMPELQEIVPDAFAGRVAGSLLRAAGLPELVTTSLAQYEALALALAQDPARNAAVKAKLAAALPHCALYDTERYCRHLEAAYVAMWERQQLGEPPAAFAVASLP